MTEGKIKKLTFGSTQKYIEARTLNNMSIPDSIATYYGTDSQPLEKITLYQEQPENTIQMLLWDAKLGICGYVKADVNLLCLVRITKLAVHSNWRKMGYGQMLLDCITQYGRDNKLCINSSIHGQGWIEKRGFKKEINVPQNVTDMIAVAKKKTKMRLPNGKLSPAFQALQSVNVHQYYYFPRFLLLYNECRPRSLGLSKSVCHFELPPKPQSYYDFVFH